MKGVKLLFTALLCLVAGRASAQITYDLRSSASGTDFKAEWTSGTVQLYQTSYNYTFQIIDYKSGLVFRCPSLYGENKDTDEDCYVGLVTDYKTGAGTTYEGTTYSATPVDSVAIPSTITVIYNGSFSDGSTQLITRVKKVKYIVDEGFTTQANGTIPDYDSKDGSGYVIYKGNGNTMHDRSRCKNPYLRKVTFTPDPTLGYQLLKIGERAFQGCTKLESAMIPPSVTEMGESTFAMCFKMKNFEFATESKQFSETDAAGNTITTTQEATNLAKIPDNCFYLCNTLESLEIPYGVTALGDYALQDNWALKSVTFPNTLTSYGSHNLCRAINLESFYMPSSVTFIDAAFMHGCESMRHVYMLGNAADLNDQASSDKGNTRTFAEETSINTAPHCRAVNNCTFHVTNTAHEGYIASSSTWYRVYGGANNVYGKEGKADTYNSADSTLQHNRIVWPDNTTDDRYIKDFGPYKWQSVIFYNKITKSEFVKTFGSDALAAKFTDCYKDSKDSKLYHLGFTTINLDNEDVPANTPLMIYIGKETVKGYQMNTDNAETDIWRAFYTQRYNVEQKVDLGSRKSGNYADGETVIMVGLAVPIPMHENEFFFKWIDKGTGNAKDNYGLIYRTANAGDANKGRFSCFWQIKKNGVRVQNAQVNSAKGFVPMADDFNAPTGINNVKVEDNTSFDVNIYDINGRLVGTSRSSLPKGLYIQGGKKFIKK